MKPITRSFCNKLSYLILYLMLCPTIYGDWQSLDSSEKLAETLSKELAQKLVGKLRSESTKVVFTNLSKCESGSVVTDSWCESYMSELHSEMIQGGINFLSESDQSSIRAKIAQEQSYQYSSQQVDLTSAVELGKQKAFQAYVDIVIAETYGETIRITAKSINIKNAVATVSERVGVSIKRDASRRWGTWFKGIGVIAIGGAMTSYGYSQGSKYADDADKKYESYKKATTASEATTARKEVKDLKQKGENAYSLAGVGFLTVLGGWWYISSNVEHSILINREVTQSAAGSIPICGQRFDWGIVPTPHMVSLVIGTDI